MRLTNLGYTYGGVIVAKNCPPTPQAPVHSASYEGVFKRVMPFREERRNIDIGIARLIPEATSVPDPAVSGERIGLPIARRILLLRSRTGAGDPAGFSLLVPLCLYPNVPLSK